MVAGIACPITQMNSSQACGKWSGVLFRLDFFSSSNPGLRAGWYNGTLNLKAVAKNKDGEPEWSQPILVSVSVRAD